MTTPATSWPAAWSALAALDGAAWDAEDARLSALWRAEYRAAFIAYAMGRPGWAELGEANAADWADSMVDDALVDCRGTAVPPQKMAEIDVRASEREAENAA